MDEMLSHALHTLDGMANGTSLSQMDPDETVTVLEYFAVHFRAGHLLARRGV
jgi:hypothetical protein